MSRIFFVLLFSALIVKTSAQQAVEVYQLESDHTYIQAPLEKEIYFYSQDANLNDVYVQDAQGNNLPFRIIATPHKSQGVLRETLIPFFAIAPDTSTDLLQTLSSTRIEIKSDQVQVEVSPEIKQLVESKATPEFYLLDLQNIQKRSKTEKGLQLKALIMDWDKPQDQYQTWALSGSNDLRHWQLIRNSSLVKLEKEGYQLIQNKIDLNLSPESYAYLKLTCIEFCSDLRFTRIRLEEESRQDFVPPSRSWSIAGEPVTARAVKLSDKDNWQAGAAWEFNRDDVATIDLLGVEFGQKAYGDKLRILGKNRQQDAWSLVYQGVWFNVKVGKDWQASSPINLQRQWRHFRLELATPASDLSPQLVLQTEPRLIQFVGNQNSPYKLVVKPGTLGSQSNILNAMLKDYSPTWVNHQWLFLSPPRPEPKMRVISWQSFLLWGCMLLAVVMLVSMTIKLFRQMNTPSNSQSDDGYKK